MRERMQSPCIVSLRKGLIEQVNGVQQYNSFLNHQEDGAESDPIAIHTHLYLNLSLLLKVRIPSAKLCTTSIN